MYNSLAIIWNCTIKNSGLDGIYIDDSSPEIYDCSFIENKGYGIMIYDSSPFLENNTFKNNLNGDIKRI
jgi:parallel beta-helix repeat protein